MHAVHLTNKGKYNDESVQSQCDRSIKVWGLIDVHSQVVYHFLVRIGKILIVNIAVSEGWTSIKTQDDARHISSMCRVVKRKTFQTRNTID